MATDKLPEIPNELPPASTSVRDDVYDRLERFMGPSDIERRGGVPIYDTQLFGNDYEIKSVLKRIKNIPQWERGLNSKPELKAEWDAYFALLPKWYDNVLRRLNEKNNLFSADGDATAESREINWMISRLNNLQTAIDFAAQEVLAPPPDPKFAPAQSAEVKAAIEALDKEFESTRAKLTEISARGGAADEGPKVKEVFKAYRAYVKQWTDTKPNFVTVAQVPTEATKKALAGFIAEAEAAWALDNPGKPAPPPTTASSAPPPVGEPPAVKKAGISTTVIWAAAGVLGLGALFLVSRKR